MQKSIVQFIRLITKIHQIHLNSFHDKIDFDLSQRIFDDDKITFLTNRANNKNMIDFRLKNVVILVAYDESNLISIVVILMFVLIHDELINSLNFDDSFEIQFCYFLSIVSLKFAMMQYIFYQNEISFDAIFEIAFRLIENSDLRISQVITYDRKNLRIQFDFVVEFA